MLRHLRLYSFCFLIVCSAIAHAIEDIELAEDLIAEEDCDNAIPVLVSIYKNPAGVDRKRILLDINTCAEKTLNYTLKQQSERELLKLDPKNETIQLKYLDSLFYLSKYQELINVSKNSKNLKNHDDYWMLLGRSLYEINENEKAVGVFEAYLRTKNPQKKDEAYYWLTKNYIQLEEYSLAEEYATKLNEEKEIASWLKGRGAELLEIIRIKNRRFSMIARIQAGTDSNILRLNQRISDNTYLADMFLDYKLLNKSKNTLTLGFDINYQTYEKYGIYETISLSPRIGQTFELSKKVKAEYLISGGKSMTDFKADQNYLFLASFFYFQLTDSIEIQPSVTYIEYLNNNPVQQYNISLLTNFYFEKSFFWFGPYYRTSTSPEAVIDSTTYIYPVVLDRSLTTRFNQTGLLLGYQFSLSDSFSLLTQGSLSQSKYVSPDLSGYTASQVDNFEDRLDLNQSLKMTLTYRQSPHVKYNLSAVHTGSTSKGFQGFTTTSVPVNNYNQLQVLLGVTFKIP